MKTMKMVLMLLLLMSIKVMMRDDEVQISKRSVMILIKSECWWLCREKGQEWSWMRVNEKHADVHFNYPNKRHCMYIEVLQSCSISIKHMEAASSLQSWAFWASSDVQLLQVATGQKCKMYLCNSAHIVLSCNSVQLFAMQCSFVQLLQEKKYYA